MVKQTLCPFLIFKSGPPYVHHQGEGGAKNLFTIWSKYSNAGSKGKTTIRSKGGLASG